MNSALIEKFNELIISKTILFKRYITNGDPFAKLPITSKKFENSYYFPDDYDESLSFVAITCNHIKKTRKVLCNLKNKTKKRKIDIKSHGIYLGVSYKGAANNVTDLNKEIIRDTNNDTICRIIIGGNNDNFRAVFFNLTEAKMKKQDFISSKLAKIKKTFFQVDYKHQDIYINKKMFEKLIKASAELDNENLNPLISDKIVEIEHKNPKQELNCI
jgi:protein involved in ribonucleotide reduction